MRIALVAWQGSGHTRRFAEYFASHGHDVHVITCGGADPAVPGAAAHPDYQVVDLGPPRGGKLGYLAKIPRARRLLRRLEPDLVNAHTATSYGMLAAAAGVHPLVVTTHGSDVLLSPSNPVMRPLVRRVLRTADLITTPGEHMATAIAELVDPISPEIVVLQYGVDVDELATLGQSVRARVAGDAPRRLVSARPLEPLYRTDLTIRALSSLPGWQLDVAGDGSQRHALEQLVVELGLGARVTFHGSVAERAAEQLIAAADCYVSMASSDGVSIALLEALALGTLPVLSDITANRAWVTDGLNGVLVAPEPPAVADAVERAAVLDREEARRVSLERVRARADRDTNLRALLGHFEDLIRPGVAATDGAGL